MHVARNAFLSVMLFSYLSAPYATAEPGIQVQTTADLAKFEQRVRDVVKRVGPAVVMLRWKEENRSQGSGVVIDSSGLILTHGHHEQQHGAELEVVFRDNTVAPAKILSVYRSIGDNWSVIKIEQRGTWPTARLHSGSLPSEGEVCLQMGYPDMITPKEIHSPLLRIGRVIAAGRAGIYAHCLTYMGDSGGPLFDLNGSVIGITNSSTAIWSAESPGYWVGVPSSLSRDVLLGAPAEHEAEKFGLIGKNRQKLDRNRGLPVAAFKELLPAAQAATVQILVDRQPVCLGTVVDSDGLILSKRSCVLTRAGTPVGEINCRMGDGSVLPVRAVANRHEHDVVLLKVERHGLAAVPWSEEGAPPQGALIAAAAFGDSTVFVGTVSSDHAFAVKPVPAEIGFDVETKDTELRIKEYAEGLKERCYGYPKIKSGDVLTHVNGSAIDDRDSYLSALKFDLLVGGDQIDVTIVRDDKEEHVAFPTAEGIGRAYESYLLSRRRSGFESVIGHDAAIHPEYCGGAIVDTNGRVVGISIARYQNYLTLAIPHSVAGKLVNEMMAEIAAR